MIKLFTHNDLDGAGCSVLIKSFYSTRDPQIDVSYVNYDNIDSEIENFIKTNKKWNRILITDISPKRETCDLLDSLYDGKNINLFDHHVTKSWVSMYKWATFNEKLSGTAILYEHLKTIICIKDLEIAKEFVNSVDAWDLWKLGSKYRHRGENLNSLYKFIGMDDFVSAFVMDKNADKNNSVFPLILRFLENNKQRYVNRAIKEQLTETEYHMDGLGNTFKILFCTDYVSEVGHAALLNPESEDLKYIVIVNPITNTCSLRSVGEFDVSKIAKALGGGGHKNASGFLMRFRTKLEKSVHNKLLSIN